MYSVLDYAQMAADSVRMDAYARAIEKSVSPGAVVVDLGSGTGIFALLAARAGARHVHAIDENPAVWLVEDLARENGLGDRIEVHHERSFDVELPERADVVISDLRGSAPMFGDHLGALHDARNRWLKPDGILLPLCDEVFVGLVEHPRLFGSLEPAWTTFERCGFRATSTRTSVLNSVHGDRPQPVAASDLLTEGKSWARIAYGEAPPATLDGNVRLTAMRGGVAHGLVIWFAATVTPGIGYDTAPGKSMTYGRTFLPLLEPVPVAHGDIATISIRVDARGERWAWDTRISDASDREKSRHRQTTFFGKPTSAAALARESSSHAPQLSSRGELVRAALALVDGSRTLEAIADQVASGASSGERRRVLEELREAMKTYAR